MVISKQLVSKLFGKASRSALYSTSGKLSSGQYLSNYPMVVVQFRGTQVNSTSVEFEATIVDIEVTGLKLILRVELALFCKFTATQKFE